MQRVIFQFEHTSSDLFVDCLAVTTWLIWIVHRTITLNTEDRNFSVSVLPYKDLKSEDIWTTIPFLTMEDDVFAKICPVCYVINSFFFQILLRWRLERRHRCQTDTTTILCHNECKRALINT